MTGNLLKVVPFTGLRVELFGTRDRQSATVAPGTKATLADRRLKEHLQARR